MNTRRPYRAILIFLVGRSHCGEAVENLKEMACCLARLLSRQCTVHTSQKIHRSLYLYSCYSRMWGEELTRRMISEMRRSLMITGKRLMLSAIFMIPYDWENNQITDEKLESCVKEYETVEELRRATVCCEECLRRQVVDDHMPDVDYCTCKGKLGFVDRSRQFDSWETFLERENILVWRRKHHVHSHLYSYKVYGAYDDTSLSAFMETQLNPSFRTQWDTSALELKILNSDQKSNSDLMYWLVKFPHFFANRDYVFKRRYHVNEEKKEVVIVNEIAQQSQVPESNGIHRVTEYWSIMVLRAKDSFNKPGMTYTLTYFDNPGTSLPSVVTNYVASTAFPDFLHKVHRAAMCLQQQWQNGEDVYVSLPDRLRYPRRLEVPMPIPELPQSRAIVSSDGESDEIKMCKHSIMETEDLPKSEVIGDCQDCKIPVRFRKVVVNLLEALEVVSPEYEEKTALTGKIEAAVDKLGLDRSSRDKLVKRLETLRSKTRTFMTDAAKKKEESFKIMKEFERRKYYYEQSSPDEKTLVLFLGLLKAVNDVLKADNDMRTGKGFAAGIEKRLSEDQSPSTGEGEPQNLNFDAAPDKTGLSNVSNMDALKPTVAFCEHDSSTPTNVGSRPAGPPWYYFTFIYSWWGTNAEDRVQSEDLRPCACNPIAEKQKDIIKEGSDDNNNAKNIESQESRSWYYYLWGFLTFNAFREDQGKGPVTNENEGVESSSSIKATNDDKGSDSGPWYFFPWLFKFWTRENV